MSTQLRRVAQAPAHSPARAKYFLAVAALDDGGDTAGDDVVYLSATGSFESAMSLADFSTQLAAGATIAANSLLRDLGREVVVYADANPNAHLYKYRQVISVNGPTTEGVGATTGPYVLVWSAAGTNVNVVRTG